MTWNWGMLPYVVVLLLMAWRVWRLEARVGVAETMEHSKVDAMFVHENLNESFKLGIGHTNERVASLARALGYEWKRTDAKEGWERSAVASVKPDAPKNPFSEYLRGALWTEGFGSAIPWTYRPTAADRRKADRRKPAPQAAPKSPPKKRRAH